MRTEQEDRLRYLETEVARLRDVLDRAPSVSYTCTPDSAYELTSMTANVRELGGYAPERFLEDVTFWRSVIHADDRERVLRQVQAAVDGPNTYDYRYLDADGATRWVRDTRRLLPASGQAEAHVAGTWLDITAEKEWEDRFARLNADTEGHVSDRTKMLLQEAGEHRRTRATLDQVISSARCRLWKADVEYADGQLQWLADPATSEPGPRALSGSRGGRGVVPRVPESAAPRGRPADDRDRS